MPLLECLFIYKDNLCKEYPAFTPFALEKESFKEIIKLHSNLQKMRLKEKPGNAIQEENKRVKAGDDWF